MNDEIKAGWKTTEFWLSLAAMIVGALITSGLLSDGTLAATIVGGIATILGALGYTASRGKVKAAASQASAVKTAAKIADPSAP